MNTILGQSTGVCPVCRRLAPVRQWAEAGQVWQKSLCPEHGEISRCIHSDAQEFLKEEHYIKPAWIPRQHAGDATKSCPDGCGHCTRHEQHLCMPIVEITSRCDLDCPICIARAGGASPDLDPATFSANLDRLLVAEGQIDILNLSGGEPLLHPKLLTLIDLALAKPGIVRVSISTNGLQLLRNKELLPALVTRGVTISLQCDGLDDTVTSTLRGRPLAEPKRQILKLLCEQGVSTSLVMTLQRSVNEHCIRELVDLLFSKKNIVSLMIQPLSYCGRAGDGARPNDALDITGSVQVLANCGHPALSVEAFLPLPCSHPRCFRLAFFVMSREGKPIPLTRLIAAERYLDTIANRTVFGLDPEEHRSMQDLVYELWSGPMGQGPDARAALDAVRDLLKKSTCGCSGFDARRMMTNSEQTIKSIFLHGFQDPWTFDLARLRRCCNAYVQPDGRLIPACAHNVLGGREKP